jgi:DNA-binding beta-propeller fold protein YncE
VNKPRSVAVDHSDNLYVVDMTGRIQKFSPEGKFLLAVQMPNTALGKPKGMGCDNDGNVIVVEPHYKRVNHFTPEGQLVAQWGVVGQAAGKLEMPRSVAVNSQGEIFVSEYGLVERVQKFRLSTNAAVGDRGSPGRRPALQALPLDLHLTDAEALAQTRPTRAEFLASYGKPGGAPGEFNRAEGICVDAQDRLYVADSCNHRVQVFTSDGKFLREFGKPGSAPGELSYPYDVKVDAAGNVFVCEFGNSRIQVFDGAGKSVEIIGGAGGRPGQFNNPWGIALDSHGNIYVADALNHRVQKLVRRGQTASSVGQVAGAGAL